MEIPLGAGASGEGAECVHEWILVRRASEVVALAWTGAEVITTGGFVKKVHYPSEGSFRWLSRQAGEPSVGSCE